MQAQEDHANAAKTQSEIELLARTDLRIGRVDSVLVFDVPEATVLALTAVGLTPLDGAGGALTELLPSVARRWD